MLTGGVRDIDTSAIQLVKALVNGPAELNPGDFFPINRTILRNACGIKVDYDVLLYRSVYHDFIEQKLALEVERRESETNVSVTGVPGIGKSTMLVFLLRKLLLTRKQVVYILTDTYVVYTPTRDGSYHVQVFTHNVPYPRNAEDRKSVV